MPNILLEKRDSNIPVQTYEPLPKLDPDKMVELIKKIKLCLIYY